MDLLSNDRPLFADIRESIRRGSEIICDDQDAIMVRENHSQGYFLAGTNIEKMKDLCRKMKKSDYGWSFIIIRDKAIQDFLLNEMAYETSRWCYQVEYTKGTPLPRKHPEIDIRKPREEDYHILKETYLMADEKELEEMFNDPQFFAAYDKEGHMLGYIGKHTEGSLGALHVIEEYRGRGIAEELQSYAINYCLEHNHIPYGQIFEDNQASINLSKKMGMSFSEGRICWLWKEN